MFQERKIACNRMDHGLESIVAPVGAVRNHDGQFVGDHDPRPCGLDWSKFGAATDVRWTHIGPSILNMMLHDPDGMFARCQATEAHTGELFSLARLYVDKGIGPAVLMT